MSRECELRGKMAQITSTDAPGFVYVLELEQSKWYVGFSRDTQTRIASHFLGCGALWTQKYKPLRVTEVRPGDEHLENLVTVALMCQHGSQNVRGGDYCAVDDANRTPPCIQRALHLGKRKREANGFCAHPGGSDEEQLLGKPDATRAQETARESDAAESDAAARLQEEGDCTGSDITVLHLGDGTVEFQKMKPAGKTAWRARIHNTLAAQQCPSRLFKTMYAEKYADLAGDVYKWWSDSGGDLIFTVGVGSSHCHTEKVQQGGETTWKGTLYHPFSADSCTRIEANDEETLCSKLEEFWVRRHPGISPGVSFCGYQITENLFVDSRKTRATEETLKFSSAPAPSPQASLTAPAPPRAASSQ